VEWLTWDEVHSLLGAITEFRYGLAAAWLFFTGCRVGEACAARQEDVRAIQTSSGDEIYVWTIPDSKTHTPRQVYLPDYLVPFIKRSRAENRPKPDWPVLWDCEGRGFARSENPAYPISPRMINGVLERARQAIALPVKVTAHVAKHSYCTNWVRGDQSELSIEKLSRQVGTSPSVLRQTYVHQTVTDADWAQIKAFGSPHD
jgi:integrase